MEKGLGEVLEFWPSVLTGTYAVSGNTIIMDGDETDPVEDTDAEPDPTTYFCVSGDRLTIAAEQDGAVTGFILERQ